jgi:hypothetical protein
MTQADNRSTTAIQRCVPEAGSLDRVRLLQREDAHIHTLHIPIPRGTDEIRTLPRDIIPGPLEHLSDDGFGIQRGANS